MGSNVYLSFQSICHKFTILLALQRSKVVSSTLSFCGNTLTPSDHVLNLGVTFDPHLFLKTHISSVYRYSFYHIRQIRIARSSLDTNSAILLANALVSSKLDYCNSLPACRMIA